MALEGVGMGEYEAVGSPCAVSREEPHELSSFEEEGAASENITAVAYQCRWRVRAGELCDTLLQDERAAKHHFAEHVRADNPGAKIDSYVECRMHNCDYAKLLKKTTVLKHIMKHTNFKPPCPVCKKPLARNDSLERHMKTRHAAPAGTMGRLNNRAKASGIKRTARAKGNVATPVKKTRSGRTIIAPVR